MTMTIDANQQRYGPLHFDHMSSYSSHPNFSNPWTQSSSAAPSSAASGSQGGGSQALFVGGQDSALPHLNLNGLAKHAQSGARTGNSSSASIASYGAIPVTAASAGSPLMADVYRHQNLLSAPQDLLSIGNRMPHPTSSAAYDTASYTSASPVNATYAPSQTPYDQLGYAQAPMRSAFALAPEQDHARRYSSQSGASRAVDQTFHVMGARVPPDSLSDYNRSAPQDDRKSFQDALEASHGMLSMSQETPRNIYDVRKNRGSTDSYGFPSHSTSSSISSASLSPYYQASADGSVSDYSTAGSDIESLSGRTLPRPSGLMAAQPPPAPQSMMSSFSAKVASSTQKKHKCKVCDKRFTRPSSLQTHMYSHTGEKPFACTVPGCGRNFSVVSNLRRHRKVHKYQGSQNGQEGQEPDTPSETGSEDHSEGHQSEDQSDSHQSD